MSEYNHTTLLQFRSKLKLALDSDPTISNFWPDLELNKIIKEALLTFGAISGFHKDEILLNTVNTKRLYDIFTDATTTIAVPSLTCGDIIDWLNIDLIENISILNPTSALFSLDELLALIDSKYNLYQLETNLILRNITLDVRAQNNIVNLPNDVLDLVRLKYKYSVDSVDYEVILQREDEETISNFDPEALTEEGIPLYYSTVYGSPNEIKLYPIPNLTGTLEVLFVGTRDLTQTLTIDTIVNLPNNIVPYLKYAVEEDIFNKDGLLNDPSRAAYCAKRWQEGLTIGRHYTSILTAKANGLPISTDSLNKLDDYTDILIPSSDPPNILGLAGFNIFEIDNLPNTDINSISAIIINNMPFPTLDGDFINIEIGYIDMLTNYCVHLCQLKCGATELASTNSYLEDFLQTSLNHNERLRLKGISFESLVGRTKLEERQIQRLPDTVQSQQQAA